MTKTFNILRGAAVVAALVGAASPALAQTYNPNNGLAQTIAGLARAAQYSNGYGYNGYGNGYGQNYGNGGQAAVQTCSAAVAQRFGGRGYGSGYGGYSNGYNNGYANNGYGNTDQYRTDPYVRGHDADGDNDGDRGGYAYNNGYGYNGYGNMGRVVSITSVEPRNNGAVRVHGIATGNAYGRSSYAGRGNGNQFGFTCKVDGNGRVVDLAVDNSNLGYRRY